MNAIILTATYVRLIRKARGVQLLIGDGVSRSTPRDKRSQLNTPCIDCDAAAFYQRSDGSWVCSFHLSGSLPVGVKRALRFRGRRSA